MTSCLSGGYRQGEEDFGKCRRIEGEEDLWTSEEVPSHSGWPCAGMEAVASLVRLLRGGVSVERSISTCFVALIPVNVMHS